jgi:CRISPR/Cas system CSM-associated protein Csm2 small subunit
MTIDNAKTVIRFAVTIGHGIERGMEDGKFQFNDAMQLLPAIVDLPAAVNAAANLNFSNLTKSEIDELTNYAVNELDLKNDNVEKRIEDALIFVAALYHYVKSFVNES